LITGFSELHLASPSSSIELIKVDNRLLSTCDRFSRAQTRADYLYAFALVLKLANTLEWILRYKKSPSDGHVITVHYSIMLEFIFLVPEKKLEAA